VGLADKECDKGAWGCCGSEHSLCSDAGGCGNIQADAAEQEERGLSG
jgi:hypothetical protein